jgi:hypothetical protein
VDPLDDVEIDPGLRQPDDRHPEPIDPDHDKSNWPVVTIAVAIVLVAAVIVAVWWYRRPAPEPPHQKAALQLPAEQPDKRAPLGPDVAPITLPPLDVTDPLVRELLRGLSFHPELAAWLATSGLIRTFVVSVENVAGGTSPAKHLKVLAPSTPFRAQRRGDAILPDPRAYQRYNGIAETLASFDAAALARIYSTLKPRLVDAYKELGHPEGDIDRAVEQAIVHLLSVPVVGGDLRLKEHLLSYHFERADLEELSGAQKQLLRMGPENVLIVQDKLLSIARELGIPVGRLPKVNERH